MNGHGTITLYSRDSTEIRKINKVENVSIVDDHLRIRYRDSKNKIVIIDTSLDYIFEYYS